jgi:acyl-CoA thioester hydrolase
MEKLSLTITPRFCELDGLGHINNSVPLNWCEQARIPLFKIFIPGLEVDKWRLIIARNEIDYLAPIEFGKDVQLETHLSKLGNSSIHIEHEIFQNKTKMAHVKAVMIHFNYQKNQSEKIPATERKELEKYLKV